MTDADMPTEDQCPAPEDNLPQVPLPPRREPLWQLILGIALFVGMLLLVWDPFNWIGGKRTPVQPDSSSFATTILARQYTYLVMTLSYYGGDKEGQNEYQRYAAIFADQTAGLWEQAAQSIEEKKREDEITAEDKRTVGKLRLNAAALYGVAGKDQLARNTLMEAEKTGGDIAAAARALEPLYIKKTTPVKLTPDTRRVLDSISTGPLFLARNALAAGDSAGALRALRPGRDAGIRVFISFGIIFLLMFGVFIAAIVIFAAKFGPITRAIGNITACPAPKVGWGVGAALILLVLPYFLSDMAFLVLQSALHITGVQASIVIKAMILIIFVIAELAIVLRVLGHPPFAWGVFGWRAPRITAVKGLLAILVAFPGVWLLSIVSSVIFRDRVEMNPLIPTTLTSHSWLFDVALFLIAVVMAPVLEETLFRGVLFRALDQHISFWVAGFVNGVLFALVHGQLVAILPIAGLGMLFCLLTRRYQSIWPNAIAHGVFNGFSMLMTLITAWSLRGPGS